MIAFRLDDSAAKAAYELPQEGLPAGERVMAHEPDRVETLLSSILLAPFDEKAFQQWLEAEKPLMSEIPCAPKAVYAYSKQAKSGVVSQRFALMGNVQIPRGRERTVIYTHHSKGRLTCIQGHRGKQPTHVASSSGTGMLRDRVGVRLVSGFEEALVHGYTPREADLLYEAARGSETVVCFNVGDGFAIPVIRDVLLKLLREMSFLPPRRPRATVAKAEARASRPRADDSAEGENDGQRPLKKVRVSVTFNSI
jgi:hypothetical protein